MSNKRNFMSNFRNNRKNSQNPEDIVGEFQNRQKSLEVEDLSFNDLEEEEIAIGKVRPSSRGNSKVVNVVENNDSDLAVYGFDDDILIIEDNLEEVGERVPAYQTQEQKRALEEERLERIREEERIRIREEERERIAREERERIRREEQARIEREELGRYEREERERLEREEREERERLERENKESMFEFESSYSVSERTIKPVLSGNKREIKVGVIDIQPIKIPKIHDTEGLISERIRSIEDKTGISVLPFSITDTLPQVESLADHDIVEIGGERYSSGTTRVVNQRRLDAYVEDIKNCIARGQAFEDSLLERQEVNGHTFETMKFNIRELETLNSLFINIVMSIYEDETGDIKINVGGYYV